jgi:hypothetical protein
VERAEARAGGYRPAAGGGAAASRADAALVRGIAWVGPGGEVWSSSGHSFLLPLGFVKGRDGGGLGDFARRETSESSSTLWAPPACWGRSRCGKRSSVGKEAPSSGGRSTLQARAIAPPHGEFRAAVLWQAKIYL